MKLHPLTAVRDALAYGMRVASFAFFASLIGAMVTSLPVEVGIALVPLGAVAGAVYGVARYLAFAYEVDATTLTIRSGVFRRRAREIPLERVQNVDVEESFLQRLLGLAVVRFETAGGGSTEGTLSLVSVDEAEVLQGELRRRKREAHGTAGGGADGLAAAEAEPTLLYELSPRGLALLAAVSFRWGTIPVVLFSTPFAEDLLLRWIRTYVVPVLLAGRLSLSNPRILGVALGGVVALLSIAWVLGAAITVTRYYRFRLTRVDDELRYERGLLQRYSGSVPLEKVQHLAVEENVAMRQLGYAALTIETAGYAPGGGGGSGRSPSAIPLAPRETVLGLVDAIEGVEDVTVVRPPARARRRYAGRYALVVLALAAVFAAVHAYVLALGVLWAVPAIALLATVPAAHLKWANRGHRTGTDHVVTRSGVLRRATRVVPYFRLQTVFTERTVFQRRWGLATVVADTAASSGLRSREGTAHDLDDGDARRLHEELVARFRADLARRRAGGRARGRRGSDDGGLADDATGGNGSGNDAVGADDATGPGDGGNDAAGAAGDGGRGAGDGEDSVDRGDEDDQDRGHEDEQDRGGDEEAGHGEGDDSVSAPREAVDGTGGEPADDGS